MKVTVLGWYGHDNIGDDAYELAFSLLLPEHELTFTDKLDGSKVDAIILGGGDILYNNFSEQLIPYSLIPKYAFSVSVRDEVLPPVAFKKIISRDNPSFPGCSWLPDFTFALTPDADNGRRLVKKIFTGLDLYDKVCVVVINSNLMAKECTLARDSVTLDKFAFDLAHAIDHTNASFLFLPFGNGFPFNDRITNSMVYARCKFWKKTAIIYEKYNPQQVLDIISAVDLVISTRLHASVFSCIGGTPFIDITHHDKNRFFVEAIGKQGWSVDYWRFCLHRFNLLMKDLLNKNYRKELLTMTHHYKDLLHSAAPSLLS